MKKIIAVLCILLTFTSINVFAEDSEFVRIREDGIGIKEDGTAWEIPDKSSDTISDDILVGLDFIYSETDGEQLVSGEKFTVNAEVSNCADISVECFITIALYNRENCLRDGKTRCVKLKAGECTNITEYITMPNDDAENYYIKITAWEAMSENGSCIASIEVSNELIRKDGIVENWSEWNLLPHKPTNAISWNIDSGVRIEWGDEHQTHNQFRTYYVIIAKNSEGKIVYKNGWTISKWHVIPYNITENNTLYVAARNRTDFISEFAELVFDDRVDDIADNEYGGKKIELNETVTGVWNSHEDCDYFIAVADKPGMYYVEEMKPRHMYSKLFGNRPSIAENYCEAGEEVIVGVGHLSQSIMSLRLLTEEPPIEYSFVLKRAPYFTIEEPYISNAENKMIISGKASWEGEFEYKLSIYDFFSKKVVESVVGVTRPDGGFTVMFTLDNFDKTEEQSYVIEIETEYTKSVFDSPFEYEFDYTPPMQ